MFFIILWVSSSMLKAWIRQKTGFPLIRSLCLVAFKLRHSLFLLIQPSVSLQTQTWTGASTAYFRLASPYKWANQLLFPPNLVFINKNIKKFFVKLKELIVKFTWENKWLRNTRTTEGQLGTTCFIRYLKLSSSSSN